MTTPTDEQVIKRVAQAIDQKFGPLMVENHYEIAKVAIAAMQAIEREAAESKRAMWCATEGTYD